MGEPRRMEIVEQFINKCDVEVEVKMDNSVIARVWPMEIDRQLTEIVHRESRDSLTLRIFTAAKRLNRKMRAQQIDCELDPHTFHGY